MRNRKYVVVACLVMLLLASAVLWQRLGPVKKVSGQLALNDPRCSSSSEAWAHVYRPERLQVIESCLAVTGTVTNIRTEADGDLHVLVALDPGQEDLLNEENRLREHGELVAEIVCARVVKQLDAIGACSGWENRMQLHHGQHLRFIGSHVLDREHGWMELHPVFAVEDY